MATVAATNLIGLNKDIIPKHIKEKMSSWFFCRLCNVIMLHVFQLACGHLVCQNCRKRLEKDGLKTCPEDSNCNDVILSNSTKIFEDRFQGRTIQQFVVECIFSQFGCTWKGELVKYADHHENCPKRPIQIVEQKEIFEFVKQGKVLRSLPLSPGGVIMKHSQKTSLPLSIGSCPYCPWTGYGGAELESHLSLDCEEAELLCPFTEVGCPEHKRQKRADLEEHSRIGHEIHLDLLLKDHLSLRRIAMTEFDSQHDIKRKWTCLEDNFKKLSIDMNSVNSKVDVIAHDLDLRISQIQTDVGDLKKSTEQKDMSRLESRLNDLEAMLHCFQEDGLQGPRDGNFEGRLNRIEASFEKLNSTLQKQEGLLSSYEQQLKFKDARLESLEQLITSNEVTSYDGVLLWRIADFTRKRHEAITRKKTYILSPPFCSGPRGYKMCMRVYLNGDGQGKGTHISIFFTVLKGPYDAVLPWPFKQVVRLAILDQNGAQNAEDSFRPDPNSVSFQRPKKDANISSGCPVFLPLSALASGGYVQDDCMFLKTTVDAFSM